jgi:hypothetical protein
LDVERVAGCAAGATVPTLGSPPAGVVLGKIVGRCWICKVNVRAGEATIAPTVCARCYDSLHAHWR